MIILDTTPDNGAAGIPLEQQISIVFDEEIDMDSAVAGNIVLATSASKVTSRGPGFEDFIPLEGDLLDSYTFTGTVSGAISSDDRLTILLTPAAPLEANKLYRVLISTDLVTRTIGDVTADAGNTSTGAFTLRGPYSGSIADTFTIEVSTAGALGAASFTYTRTSDGLVSDAIITDRNLLLEDGIYIKFQAGTYVEGDSWTFTVSEGTSLDAIYEFSFTTGGSTHVQVSEDTPSVRIERREIQGINRVDGAPAVDSGSLAVVSILPENQSTNVPLSQKQIVVEFSKEIDPASLDAASIRVLMENLPLDEDEQYSTNLRVRAEVSGNRLILTFNG